MQFKISLTFILGLGVLISGCGGGSTTPTGGSNTNLANTNINAAPPVTNSGLDTVKKPEGATTNNAPTLAPVVNAYYDALKKKDDAAVRKVLSADFVRTLDAEMKAEKKTNLAAYLAETDQIPEKPMEVRNEKIEGSKGVAEVKGGSYATFAPIAFVNEGGQWKMTNETPSLK